MEMITCLFKKVETTNSRIETIDSFKGTCYRKPTVGERFNIFSSDPSVKGGLNTSPVVSVSPHEDGFLVMTENSIYFYKELKNEVSTDSNSVIVS